MATLDAATATPSARARLESFSERRLSGNADGLLEHAALVLALTHGALQLAASLRRRDGCGRLRELELRLVDLRLAVFPHGEPPRILEIDVPPLLRRNENVPRGDLQIESVFGACVTGTDGERKTHQRGEEHRSNVSHLGFPLVSARVNEMSEVVQPGRLRLYDGAATRGIQAGVFDAPRREASRASRMPEACQRAVGWKKLR